MTPLSRAPRLSTRALLQLTAFAAAACLLGAASSALNAAVAVLSPLLYAITGSVWMLLPMTARIWSRLPGAAIIVAAITGMIMLPFTALGILLPLMLLGQALVFEAMLWRSPAPGTVALIAAGAATGILIGVASLPVISPEVLTPALAAGVVALRAVATIGSALLGRMLARALERRGVRPAPQRQADAAISHR